MKTVPSRFILLLVPIVSALFEPCSSFSPLKLKYSRSTPWPLCNLERVKFQHIFSRVSSESFEVPVSNLFTKDGIREIDISNEIYVRHAESKDMKSASKILTDAFFSFNIITSPLEWLNTFFSLKDSMELVGENYIILVACQKSNDEVVAICEVDCREKSEKILAPRPYLCNLAVISQWRRNGIARTLIQICENKVSNDWNYSFLHLRVRRKNVAAIGMYEKMGYFIYIDPSKKGEESMEDILTLQKNLN